MKNGNKVLIFKYIYLYVFVKMFYFVNLLLLYYGGFFSLSDFFEVIVILWR